MPQVGTNQYYTKGSNVVDYAQVLYGADYFMVVLS